MGNYRKNLGQWGENLVKEYLVKRGYKIIARHWQKREGEIDLIAFEQSSSYLVFVEVKSRTTEAFGRPEESINNQKKRRLESIISLYITETGYPGSYRFDVIMVKKNRHQTVINHLKNVSLD